MTTTTNNVMNAIVDNAKTVSKGKVENYSVDVTIKLLAQWAESGKAKSDVEALAKTFGKTARSIVAKLSREKVYIKAAYVSKAGTPPVSKEQHVSTIAAFMGVPIDKLDSLEKANKGVLVLLESTLLKMAHMFDEVK